jgi:hypothetical protein
MKAWTEGRSRFRTSGGKAATKKPFCKNKD